MKKILLVAGGTGGHYFPAESVLEKLLSKGYKVMLITDERCKNYISYPEYTIIVDVKKLSGGKLSKIIGLINLPVSIMRSILFMLSFKPDLVIGFGGYTSFPHLFTATILNIKIALHEQNSVMGKANLLFSGRAKFIMLSYQDTIKLPTKCNRKSTFTGNFVRKKLLELTSIKKNSNYFTILILGGSQGAKAFSDKIPDIIISLAKNYKNIRIIQQVIKEDIERVSAIYSSNGVQAEINNFFYDINDKYNKADLIIARSGASTIAEIVALSKPSILIPLPSSADNHQYFNAKLLDDKFASILIQEKDIKNKLEIELEEILKNRSKLKEIQNSIKMLQINGTQILFKLVDQLFT